MHEPISQIILSSLEHDAQGRYIVAPSRLAGLRSAVAGAADLRAAVVTVLEVAFMLEKHQRSPEAAATLRALVGELTPALKKARRVRQEAQVDGARDRHNRFTAMIGGPAREAPQLAMSNVGSLKLSAIAPPRVLR